MHSTLRYLLLSLAALSVSCDHQAGDPVGPRAVEPAGAAPASSVVTSRALLLDAHALYYCYHPGSTRNCVLLKRTLRISSSGGPLNWTASKDRPWITVSPTSGTTPTTVTISLNHVPYTPPGASAFGTVTFSAPGAWDSPQKVEVVLNYSAAPPFPPLLASSDSAIGFCDIPASSGGCVRLAEHVLFTSSGASLAWQAVSSKPWIVVRPATGSTDTDVRVSVDLTKLPPRNGATSVSGALTVSAAGARNSPRTIPVKLRF